jgi:hypothetical protein
VRPALFALLLIAGAVSVSAEAPHVNVKLKGRSSTVRKALVLPALITFGKVGWNGDQSSFADSDEIASRGVEVLPNPMEAAPDDAARFAVVDLQSRYDNVAFQMHRSLGKVEKGGLTLGDRVATFGPGSNADVLVFLRGAGRVSSTARKAITLASKWMPETSFRGEILLVDARIGEILFFVRFLHYANVARKTEQHFAESVHRVMHDIPLPLPPARN